MPWRVCRILDFQKNCTSIYSREDIAKIETARHLVALITKLDQDLPKYAGIWNYPAHHPGFVEDVRTTIDSISGYLGEDDVWGAYDEWQQFMNQWEHRLAAPLWVQVGTVIVDGPGPGVQPTYDLTQSMKSSGRRSFPPRGKDLIRSAAITWHETFKVMAQDLMKKGPKVGRRPATFEEVFTAIEELSKEIDIGQPLSSEDLIGHWLKLIWLEALQRFEVSTGASLGAFKSWTVQYADFGGAWHPGLHSNEERAKADTREYLEVLMHSLEIHSDMEASLKRNTEYAKEAEWLIQHLRYLLENDFVWSAYLDFKSFQEKWNHNFGRIPLELSIGTMRVIPTPEPDEYGVEKQ